MVRSHVRPLKLFDMTAELSEEEVDGSFGITLRLTATRIDDPMCAHPLNKMTIQEIQGWDRVQAAIDMEGLREQASECIEQIEDTGKCEIASLLDSLYRLRFAPVNNQTEREKQVIEQDMAKRFGPWGPTVLSTWVRAKYTPKDSS